MIWSLFIEAQTIAQMVQHALNIKLTLWETKYAASRCKILYSTEAFIFVMQIIPIV